MRRDRDIEWSSNRSAVRTRTLRVSEDSSNPKEICESVRLFVRRSYPPPDSDRFFVWLNLVPLYLRQNSSSSTVGARSNTDAVQNCFVGSVPFALPSSHPQSPTPGHFAAKFRIAGPSTKRKNQKSQVNKLAVFTQNICKFIRPNIGQTCDESVVEHLVTRNRATLFCEELRELRSYSVPFGNRQLQMFAHTVQAWPNQKNTLIRA